MNKKNKKLIIRIPVYIVASELIILFCKQHMYFPKMNYLFDKSSKFMLLIKFNCNKIYIILFIILVLIVFILFVVLRDRITKKTDDITSQTHDSCNDENSNFYDTM